MRHIVISITTTVDMMATEKAKVRHHVPMSSFEQHLRKQATLLHHSISLACRARVLYPKWLLFVLIIYFLATPAAAQPDTTCGCSEPIIAVMAAMVFASQHAVAFSGTLIGPFMGTSSVLWLVMRNDAAIEPKWSWMLVGALLPTISIPELLTSVIAGSLGFGR